jgi:hypothetical protein
VNQHTKAVQGTRCITKIRMFIFARKHGRCSSGRKECFILAALLPVAYHRFFLIVIGIGENSVQCETSVLVIISCQVFKIIRRFDRHRGCHFYGGYVDWVLGGGGWRLKVGRK